MEAAGLYGLAMREGVQALAILTASDHLDHDLHLSAAERELDLGRMAQLALECALSTPA
jgi:purine-nucleoside phosphorylase